MADGTANVEFAGKMRGLFKPSRYKVFYGGRGGGKSVSFAKALLVKGAEQPLRILCAREIQRSIADSVHKLLSDQIAEIGMAGFYEVQQTVIRGANGTEITFAGLKHNIGNIKSAEGIDIVWVEEAQTVSKQSWEVLIPTIRKDNSEIWITFNPELEEDETYRRFVLNPPSNALVAKVNHNDNPWFPEVLKHEMEDLRERDPDAYMHVYEGECRTMIEGAVYANEMRQAVLNGQITSVPYDACIPVHTFWDLGWNDHTSIWFAQSVGAELHLIDFLQDRGRSVAWYLAAVQERGYVYGEDWLPHDAKAKTLAASMSVEQLMRGAGRDVKITPKLSVNDGINAARTIFNRCRFDADKCADGIQCLRRYSYDVDPETGRFSKQPLHDEYSDGADAFRYFAVNVGQLAVKQRVKLNFRSEFAHA